jgi:hypothetical protein
MSCSAATDVWNAAAKITAASSAIAARPIRPLRCTVVWPDLIRCVLQTLESNSASSEFDSSFIIIFAGMILSENR